MLTSPLPSVVILMVDLLNHHLLLILPVLLNLYVDFLVILTMAITD